MIKSQWKEGVQMYDTFEALERDCLQCKQCDLFKTRTNVVFGKGNPKADVLFIGEGPGKNEDLRGEPFVGRSGELFDKMLAAIGLNREKNVYIANIVKCRPPENRDPKSLEQDICIQWLREQVRIMQPKVIVCLGRIAAQRIINPEFRVTREHGKFIERNGFYLMGTYHPAALLRNPRNKPDGFQDFIILREKLKELDASGVTEVNLENPFEKN